MLRILLIAAALLLSTGSSLASPRHPTPAQWRDIRALESAHEDCAYSVKPEKVKQGCATSAKLKKKVTAQGFCFYGHGVVGRSGGSRCYALSRPR